MAFTAVGGSTHGSLSGTTAVTIVAAPTAANTNRLVKTITVDNIDSVSVNVSLFKAGLKFLGPITLNVSDTLIFDDVIGITSTGTTANITASMSTAVVTTAPTFTATWGEAT